MNRKRSTFRIDEQVFFTMGAVCLLALLIFGFRYATHHTCLPVKIQLGNDSLIAGNMIRFKAESAEGKTFSWNFGDGNAIDEESSSANHNYKNPGKYTVTVLVDGECSDIQNIYVNEAPVVVNTSLQPMIVGPDTAYTNKLVKFSDISASSVSWEWSFGETGEPDAFTKNVSYTYSQPGVKKIYLKINNRPDLVVVHFIYVIDKDAQNKLKEKPKAQPSRAPVIVYVPSRPSVDPINNQIAQPAKTEKEPEHPKAKAPDISHEQIEAMLKQVSAGAKTAEDFSAYLCGNLGTPVFYNGNALPFSKLCAQLKEMKEKKIKKISVGITRSGVTGCIESMSVSIEKKKGFLGL
ncbi:MAG: PKD domain-containing protein [Puia sp.]